MSKSDELRHIDCQIEELKRQRVFVAMFKTGGLYYIKMMEGFKEREFIVVGTSLECEGGHDGGSWMMGSELVACLGDEGELESSWVFYLEHVLEMRVIDLSELPLYVNWNKTKLYSGLLGRGVG